MGYIKGDKVYCYTTFDGCLHQTGLTVGKKYTVQYDCVCPTECAVYILDDNDEIDGYLVKHFIEPQHSVLRAG